MVIFILKKQIFKYKKSGCQFVENSTNKVISPDINQIIDNLLLERVFRRGIGRVTGVPLKNKRHEKTELEVACFLNQGNVLIECDEICTIVKTKSNRQWTGLVYDLLNGMTVGFWIGGRDQDGAKAFFFSVLPIYRQGTVCYTDRLAFYVGCFLKIHHQVAPTGSGKTNHLERVKLTLRPRVDPLVRKILAFAKKLPNLSGAVLDFINDYNRRIPLHV